MRYRLSLLIFLLFPVALRSQTVTVGLLYKGEGDQPGTVLFAPSANLKTYLIDKCGYTLHVWTSIYRPGVSAYLLEDGTLLRAGNTVNPIFSAGGGGGGAIEKLDWNSNVTWSYIISDSMQAQHHDIRSLPNGNVLALVWERKTHAEAIAAGRDTAFLDGDLWNEKIMELQPVGSNGANIVWQWSCWDHLVQDFDSTKANYGIVAQHPGRININANMYGLANEDWVHLNSVDYNPALDQILVSSRLMSEIWIIDHSTTTAQASTDAGGNSGKGGDFMYRWGNPQIYDRGTAADQKFFSQHSAHWIMEDLKDAGQIMVFNNGRERPGGDYSTVESFVPPLQSDGTYAGDGTLALQPDSVSWLYHDPSYVGFYSNNVSGAQRLPNGNTLICSGTSGLFFEVDTNNTIVWTYKNPVNLMGPVTQGSSIFNNSVFRAVFYGESYPGFSGHALVPGLPVELDPVPYSCSMPLTVKEETDDERPLVFPNPFEDEVKIRLTDELSADYFLMDITGKVMMKGESMSPEQALHTSALASGMYILNIRLPGKNYYYRLVK